MRFIKFFLPILLIASTTNILAKGSLQLGGTLCFLSSPYEYLGTACKPIDAGMSYYLSNTLAIDAFYNQFILWEDLHSVENTPTKKINASNIGVNIRNMVWQYRPNVLIWLGLGLANTVFTTKVESIQKATTTSKNSLSFLPSLKIDLKEEGHNGVYFDLKSMLPFSFKNRSYTAFGLGIEFFIW